MDIDARVRMAAFAWLAGKMQHKDVLTRAELMEGFVLDDFRIPLVAPQGIYKPKQLSLPLSITTSPESPYDDRFSNDGKAFLYAYRGTDPMHPNNVGLRTCMQRRIPLVYIYGLSVNQYTAVWPTFIVGDDPQALMFTVEADDAYNAFPQAYPSPEEEYRRRYVTASVKLRLHQRDFRTRVLQAYRTTCTICNLKHAELLDAVHIIPDSAPEGEPKVTNGLSMCKLHHSAFDSGFIGISPDYQVKTREDILLEEDGPVLQHGLKGVHGRKLILPTDTKHWPNRDYLATRFEQFRS